MITLYHCVNARSLRVLWTLEELALPYELKMLAFPPRVRAPGYLDLNPLGTVPLFLDDSVRMTESAGICQYLVARYGPTPLEVGRSEAEFGSFLNWVHFGEATLTFPQTIVLRYARLEPPERRRPDVAADYARWFAARLRALDGQIDASNWLCADRFTIADVSVGFALFLADFIGLAPQFTRGVHAYWSRLRDRTAFQQALAAQNRAAAEQRVPDFTLPDA